jgi:hypothetical protein
MIPLVLPEDRNRFSGSTMQQFKVLVRLSSV